MSNHPSDNSSLKLFRGECHCGKFAIEFKHAPLEDSLVTRCNCSICVNRGYLFVYPSLENLAFTLGSLDDMTVYYFGRKLIGHYFCPVCGTGMIEKRNNGIRYGVNLRCVKDINLRGATYRDIDRASS